MADLIRAACLTHYADVARSVRLDPAKMLKSVGLPPRSLVDPDIKIPSGGVRRACWKRPRRLQVSMILACGWRSAADFRIWDRSHW
jgi:hypothetical protein